MILIVKVTRVVVIVVMLLVVVIVAASTIPVAPSAAVRLWRRSLVEQLLLVRVRHVQLVALQHQLFLFGDGQQPSRVLLVVERDESIPVYTFMSIENSVPSFRH